MSIKIEFAKGARKYLVINPLINRKKAEGIAVEFLRSALVEGFRSVFRKKSEKPKVVKYGLKYHPFWYVRGESFFEYTRFDMYSFTVPPEVRSVTVKKTLLDVSKNGSSINFEGLSHCFEHYEKEILQDGCSEKGKNFSKYVDCKAKQIKPLRALKGEVPHIRIRASFLLNQLYSDVIKPINADKVIDARVKINSLDMRLIPIHIITVLEADKEKTVIVDGVTGEAKKDNTLLAMLTHKYWSGETVFDIGTEIAGSVIPGAGVGLILAKKVISGRKKKKADQAREKFSKAYKKKKK